MTNTTFLARNRSAFSYSQSFRRTSQEHQFSTPRSVACHMKCSCDFFRKPVVKAVFVVLLVNGVVAAILILFCALQYNKPGETLIDFIDAQFNSNTVTLPPSHSPNPPIATKGEPIPCPCFQLEDLVSTVKQSSIQIDKETSCNNNKNKEAIFYTVIMKGGFEENHSTQGFEVDMTGEKGKCETNIRSATNREISVPISYEQGQTCLSNLNRACDEIDLGVSRTQGRKFEETNSCSCFAADDLLRPSNQYVLDEKKSCRKTDNNPMRREMFYSSQLMGTSSLRKGSYKLSVVVDKERAICTSKDGKVTLVSQKMGRKCIKLMDEMCSKILL